MLSKGKHTKGLLLERQEDGIEKFEVLGEIVELVHRLAGRSWSDGTGTTHIVQDNQRLGPATIDVADGMEDTAANNRGNQLLNEESQKYAADGGEVEVVDEEERLELEWLAVAHGLATTKDDGVVDDDEDGRRLERRHGRLEGHKLEVIGRVADDGLEGLAEDGP